MADIQVSIKMLKELRKESIKKRHWIMIFKELGLQSLIGKEEFTLLDLLSKAKIYSF